MAVLIGWVFNGLGSWNFGRARAIVLCFALFLIWFCLSATQALDRTVAWNSIITLSKVALPFFVGVTMIKSERQWRPLLWTLVLCQGYVGFEENLTYLKGFNTAAEGFGGMDNNFFGLSLVTMMGAAVALTLSARSWIERGLAALSVALILHTTMLTFSRGAMLGLITVGLTAAVMMPKQPKYVGGLLIVLLLAARLTGPQLLERYGTAFASSEARDGSSQNRVDLWKDCLKVVQSYPLFGVGPANWRTISSNYGWTSGKSAHSVWMESAAELGIPGMSFLLLFFVAAGWKMWPLARERLTDENRYEVAVASGVVLSVVGFIVSGQFVSAPALEVPYYVIMLGVGVLRSRAERESETSKSTVVESEAPAYPVSPFGPLRPAPINRTTPLTGPNWTPPRQV